MFQAIGIRIELHDTFRLQCAIGTRPVNAAWHPFGNMKTQGDPHPFSFELSLAAAAISRAAWMWTIG